MPGGFNKSRGAPELLQDAQATSYINESLGGGSAANSTGTLPARNTAAVFRFSHARKFRAHQQQLEKMSEHRHRLWSERRAEQSGKDRAVAMNLSTARELLSTVRWDSTYHKTSILDMKLQKARDEGGEPSVYHVATDDLFREERPDANVDKEHAFSCVFHRDDNESMRLQAARDQAGLLNGQPRSPRGLLEADMRRRWDKRPPWDGVCPNMSSKWENQVARMRVAVDQEDFTSDGHMPEDFQHRTLAKGVQSFVTNFHSVRAPLNMDGTRVELLVETEAKRRMAIVRQRHERAATINAAHNEHEATLAAAAADAQERQTSGDPLGLAAAGSLSTLRQDQDMERPQTGFSSRPHTVKGTVRVRTADIGSRRTMRRKRTAS